MQERRLLISGCCGRNDGLRKRIDKRERGPLDTEASHERSFGGHDEHSGTSRRKTSVVGPEDQLDPEKVTRLRNVDLGQFGVGPRQWNLSHNVQVGNLFQHEDIPVNVPVAGDVYLGPQRPVDGIEREGDEGAAPKNVRVDHSRSLT